MINKYSSLLQLMVVVSIAAGANNRLPPPPALPLRLLVGISYTTSVRLPYPLTLNRLTRAGSAPEEVEVPRVGADGGQMMLINFSSPATCPKNGTELKCGIFVVHRTISRWSDSEGRRGVATGGLERNPNIDSLSNGHLRRLFLPALSPLLQLTNLTLSTEWLTVRPQTN